MPRMGGVALFFALASLGLPGLANFAGEFLVLAGSYATYPVATIIATTGLVASAVYSLWLIHRVFYGPQQSESEVTDLGPREMVVFGVMIVLIAAIGLRPQPILTAASPVVESLAHETTDQADGTSRPMAELSDVTSGRVHGTK